MIIIFEYFCRNTPSGKGTPVSTRSTRTTSSNDDEMLENELKSIFSTEKSGIFKDQLDDVESVETELDPTKKV